MGEECRSKVIVLSRYQLGPLLNSHSEVIDRKIPSRVLRVCMSVVVCVRKEYIAGCNTVQMILLFKSTDQQHVMMYVGQRMLETT